MHTIDRFDAPTTDAARHSPRRAARTGASMALVASMLTCVVGASHASDHGDGHIGDFYAFVERGNLVLALTVRADIPEHEDHHSPFEFSPDHAYRFLVDTNAEVRFDDADDLARYGGTIVDPGSIEANVVLEVRFPEGVSRPVLDASGLAMRDGASSSSVVLFTGMRDEPFIRRPLIGENIPAIVAQVPLQNILPEWEHGTGSLLLWAETLGANGERHDLCGRPYGSQHHRNTPPPNLNTTHPSKHRSDFGVEPDVLIFRAGTKAVYPNGRALEDDVVDILDMSGVIRKSDLPGEIPTAAEHQALVLKCKSDEDPVICLKRALAQKNDVKFLDDFPFLAPPHDAHHNEFVQDAPDAHKGMTRSEKGRVDLGRELRGMGGRDLRLRFWRMAKDGVIMYHQHEKRPAMVYLLTGEVEEHKWGEAPGGKKLGAGTMTVEAPDTQHYWFNNGNEAVFMAAVDLVDSFTESPPEPEPDALPIPRKIFDVRTSEAAARRANTTPTEYRILGTIELRDTVPHVPEAHHYVMRGREVRVAPGEMIPLQEHAGRPGLTYVVRGEIVEYRDDREKPVTLRERDHMFNTNGVARWLINRSSEIAILFEVDVIDSLQHQDR